MTLFFSAETGAHYDSEIWGHPLPADAVEITAERHAELLAAVVGGDRIVADADGAPIAVAPAEPDDEQLASFARARRDRAIEAARPVIERHRDQVELGSATTLSAEAFVGVLTYVQALRDIPTQSGFPAAIQWPAVPAGITPQEPA